jgi:hypothetical protein
MRKSFNNMPRRLFFFSLLSFLLAFLFVASLVSAAPASNTRESTYQLQHAFGDGDGDQRWQDCGVLKTRVTDNNNAKKGKKSSSVTFHGIKVAYDKLTKQSKSQLIETAKEANGYYRVRISTTPVEESDKSSLEYVITSVKASCLVAAEYRDHFNLHFADDGKTLVSADHSASNVDCSPSSQHSIQRGSSNIDVLKIPDQMGPTTNSVKFTKVAPALSTIERKTFAKGRRGKMSDMQEDFDEEEGEEEFRYEDEEDEEGGPKKPPVDDRTWLQKNWMMALAGGMMVVNLMGSAGGQQQQRGRQQQTQQRR